jgi:hypothetical protein
VLKRVNKCLALNYEATVIGSLITVYYFTLLTSLKVHYNVLFAVEGSQSSGLEGEACK